MIHNSVERQYITQQNTARQSVAKADTEKLTEVAIHVKPKAS